jgi:hypothetical protein
MADSDDFTSWLSRFKEMVPNYGSHVSVPMYNPMKLVIARLRKCYSMALYALSNPIGRNRQLRDYENVTKLLCMLQEIWLAETGHNHIYHILIHSWFQVTRMWPVMTWGFLRSPTQWHISKRHQVGVLILIRLGCSKWEIWFQSNWDDTYNEWMPFVLWATCVSKETIIWDQDFCSDYYVSTLFLNAYTVKGLYHARNTALS